MRNIPFLLPLIILLIFLTFGVSIIVYGIIIGKISITITGFLITLFVGFYTIQALKKV